MKGMKIFGLAGAFALALGASAASAQEGELFKNLLGNIGIIPKDKEPIIYNERAPLVLPPKMDLPAPAAPNGAEANNTNWPKDPDLAARRKAAAEARTPVTATDFYKNSEGKRLSIEEIRAGRNPNQRAGLPEPSGGWSNENSRMTPDELRSFSTEKKAELSGDGIERRYLSDPPQNLLKAAPGAALKASADPVPMGDPDSPQAFIAQQNRRR
ncbi:hypothetical protein [Microvirga guangxiensis]|uniref:DUF3035 domain-containing protein n=1 Tax=Microvirga guangxiensis TaxID=549386 RepID=A0A1G5JIH3_9HYPH|nr:hypothetical protein [Microvirga guangxiensis]SCY87559.1 hypothetical protein SAMN02927923_02637 [Microvirga guangxiensis]